MEEAASDRSDGGFGHKFILYIVPDPQTLVEPVHEREGEAAGQHPVDKDRRQHADAGVQNTVHGVGDISVRGGVEQQDAQHLRMTTAPVPGLILSLSVPSIITCIITSVYNMADTFFVAQLGTAAVAAVGVVFSISSVLSALGFWMGTGGSSLVSLYLGAREKEKAHCAASTGFFLALGLGGVIAAGGLLALEPLMRLLGSTDTILPEAEAYAVPILLAAPFQCSSLALAQCLRAEGKGTESMAGQLAGGLLNIVLDPLFIYTLGMGIRGAGAATALSQVMVWAALLWFYVRGKTSVRISVRATCGW